MSERIEDIIFEAVVHDPEYSRKTLHHLLPEYFSDHVDNVLIKEIKRFYAEHNKAPTQKILKLFVEDCDEFRQDEYSKAQGLVESLKEAEGNHEWLVTRTEEFCKEKALYNAIASSIQIMDGKSTKLSKGSIPKLLSDALSVSFDNSVGHDYFCDTEDRFKFYHTKEDRIPFGLDMLNKITKGGIPRKTINIACAGTNVGKSLFLCSSAADSLRQGYNVLYITLEMSEEKIAERIDCNLLDIPLNDLYRIRMDDFTSKLSEIQHKTHGRLIVKEYPTGGAHVGHFRALMDELRQKKNFMPDVVYIDYVNICASLKYSGGNNWNSYFAVKAIVEELRGLAVEYNVAMWSATQLTRSGMGNSDAEMSDISESVGTAFTADFMGVIIRSEELDNLGQLMWKTLKSRYNDVNYYKRFVIGVDMAKFKLYDVENATENLTDTGKKDDDKPIFDHGKFVKKSQVDVSELNFD